MVNGFELVGRMSETKIACILEMWMNLVFCFLNRFYWDFLNIKMHSPGGGTLSSPECVWKASKRAEERSDCPGFYSHAEESGRLVSAPSSWSEEGRAAGVPKHPVVAVTINMGFGGD